jgi:LPS-assembly lipoprotein
MSSFKRRTLLMLPLVALAACGFTPVYAPGGVGDALRGTVQVTEMDTVDGYMLVQQLEERLGRSVDPKYDLNVALSQRIEGQAITASDATTRYSILGRATYTLVERATGSVLASDKVENFVGYSATGSTVETLASERDARHRLMIILADQLTAQLYTSLDLSS